MVELHLPSQSPTDANPARTMVPLWAVLAAILVLQAAIVVVGVRLLS